VTTVAEEDWQRDTYRPYPVDLVAELEDLLHARIRQRAGESALERERRDVRIPEILTNLSRYRPPQVGDVVAGAELLSVIDSGDFGTVWRGRVVDGREPCAVKVFHHEGLGKGRMSREFRQGVGAMRALTRAAPPRTIVRLIDCDAAQLAFSMTLVEGGDLRDIQQRGWTLEKRVSVFRDLCSAVAFAHQHKVLHRDLKPANVLIDKSGRAVLTDFDLADLLTLRTLTARSPGSLAYAAPEQLEPPRELDHAPRLVESDVYSLGRILFYLVVGSDPSGVFRQEVPELPELSEVQGLQRIVRRCTLKDPAKRYRSIEELLAELAQYDSKPQLVGCDLPGDAPRHTLHEVPPQAVWDPRAGKTQRPLWRKPTILAATILAIGGIVGATIQRQPAPALAVSQVAADHSTPPQTLTASPPASHTHDTVPSAEPDVALCPKSCCQGTACEGKADCLEKVKCQICRDHADTWRLSLRHVTVDQADQWSEVKTCISMGNLCGEQCVLSKDIGTPLGRFDCDYKTNDFRGGFVKVLGTNLAGTEQRIAQGKFSFRVGPEGVCQGLRLPRLEDRNGHVQSASLTVDLGLP
jgi:serine/threonine protein kinase